MSIAPLAREDVQRITSAQVVPDLRAAVKELVENAVDACASNIEVCFREYGLEGVEVQDNGTGVARDDYATLALKHHTSKLSSYDDLKSVTTLGFRGEALASLCGVAKVSIITATENEEPMGTVLEFDHYGALVSCDKKKARQRGTTVIVTDLLKQFPVRRKELERHIKREYNKVNVMLQAYALITPGWMIDHCSKRQMQLTLPISRGDRYLQANMIALFGARAMDNLSAMALEVCVENYTIRVNGLVSKPAPGAGRSSSDRQYLYVNRRPWESRKFAQVFNQVYKTYNPAQYPCVVANLEIDTDQYDVNVSPDKRTILVHHEAADALDAFFAPTRNVLPMQSQRNAINFPRSNHQQDRETAARPAVESVKSPNDKSRASTRQNQPLDTNDHTDSIVEEQVTLDNFSTQGTLPPFPQTNRNTSSDDDHAVVPSKRKRRPGYVPEKIPDTTASSSSSSPSACDEAEERVNREPQPHQRAQFRRAVENFVSVQRESMYDVGSWEDHEQDQRDSSEHFNSNGRHRVQRAAGVRSQAPIQDVTYAESDPEKSSEESALCYTDIPPTNADSKELHSMHDTLSESSESQRIIHPNTSPRVADDDDHDDNHISEKLSDGTDVDTLIVEPAVQNLNTDFAADASILEPDSLLEQPSHSATKHSADHDSIKIDPDTLWAHIYATASSLSDVTSPTSPLTSKHDAIDSASFQEEDASLASHALERVIQKSDFADMHIVGQFNLGFIIARREIFSANGQVTMDDLFIIDQHAADEKFNFETLQRDTQIHSQTLLHPQSLELAPSDELIAASHIDCLKKNGFEIEVNEDRSPGRRIGLRSKPMSKSVIFDVHDFEELLYKLREASDYTRIRCSKVRDMFASRACRKSIMVGSALNLHQMRRIVNHMGELDQPWNCPHGRPTMRHLISLSRSSSAPWHPPQVDWSKLCNRYPS